MNWLDGFFHNCKNPIMWIKILGMHLTFDEHIFLFTLEIVTTWILVCKYGMIVVKFPELKLCVVKV
jgi:hypothetical protein